MARRRIYEYWPPSPRALGPPSPGLVDDKFGLHLLIPISSHAWLSWLLGRMSVCDNCLFSLSGPLAPPSAFLSTLGIGLLTSFHGAITSGAPAEPQQGWRSSGPPRSLALRAKALQKHPQLSHHSSSLTRGGVTGALLYQKHLAAPSSDQIRACPGRRSPAGHSAVGTVVDPAAGTGVNRTVFSLLFQGSALLLLFYGPSKSAGPMSCSTIGRPTPDRAWSWSSLGLSGQAEDPRTGRQSREQPRMGPTFRKEQSPP